MRSIFVIVVSCLVLSVPAWAVEPASVDVNDGIQGGGGTRVDCPGDILWDTGMYDEFTPPVGCASAASSACFVNALNEGGFPEDGRRLADDWASFSTDPVTGIKIWGRFNQAGYDYHLQNGGLHGFCVKFYEMVEIGLCPDGTVPGEDAIGPIVYEGYCSNFVEEEVFTGLARTYNYCITLDTPFYPEADRIYWLSVSTDFDFTVNATQWFWRMFEGAYDPICEASWWDTWNDPPTNWMPVSEAVGQPCWAGWNASFVLYSGEAPPPEGACCFDDGHCEMLTEDRCAAAGGTLWIPDEVCDPNPCPPVATEESTWGSTKARFR